VVIGAVDREAAEPLATVIRSEGAVVLITESERACLRVATSVSPDIVLLDPRLSRGLLSLLRAHPFSRRAQVSWSNAAATMPQSVAN
jgi:DNA-binding response OmpR family regulator